MPRKLLLADDSVTIQKVVAIVFAHEDFEVTTVANGEDAIVRARELRPDIVLADVVMPGKDGYQVCEALKADPTTRDIPVLLLAGTFEPFDEARAAAAGYDGHIAKPFESVRLLDKVRQLIDGLPSGAATAPATGWSAQQPVAGQPAARPTAPAAPSAFAPAAAQPGSPFAPAAAQPGSPFAPAAAQPGSPFAPAAAQPGSPFAPAAAQPGSPFAPAAAQPGSAFAPVDRPVAAPPADPFRNTSGPAAGWAPAPRPPSSVILPPRPAPPAAPSSRPPLPPLGQRPAPAAPAFGSHAPAANPFGGAANPAAGPRAYEARPPLGGGNVIADKPAASNRAVLSHETAGPAGAGGDPFAQALAGSTQQAAAAPLGFEEDEILLDVEDEFEIASEADVDYAPAAHRAAETTAAGDSAPTFTARGTGRRELPEAELAPVARTSGVREDQASTADLIAGEPIQPLDLSELDTLGAEPVSPAVFDELPAPPRPPARQGAVLLGSPVEDRPERGPAAPGTRPERAPPQSRNDAAAFLEAAEQVPALRAASPGSGAVAGADGGEAVLREALSAASREVIEKIAWEVVPQLAEVILREHVERLVKAREGGSEH